MIPPEHKAFVERTLDDLGVPPLPNGERVDAGVLGWLHSVARSHVDVAMEHRRKYGQIKLIANALGSPPADVIQTAHDNGVLVAALAGAKDPALHHVEAGVDIVIAQGYEGGGHTGEVTSIILWPNSSTRWGIVRRCSPPAAWAAAGRSPPPSPSAHRASGWAPTG